MNAVEVNESPLLGLSNMRAALQAFQLRDNLKRVNCDLRWVASDYDLADAFTKKRADSRVGLMKFLLNRLWSIAYDPHFVAAKKNKRTATPRFRNRRCSGWHASSFTASGAFDNYAEHALAISAGELYRQDQLDAFAINAAELHREDLAVLAIHAGSRDVPIGSIFSLPSHGTVSCDLKSFYCWCNSPGHVRSHLNLRCCCIRLGRGPFLVPWRKPKPGDRPVRPCAWKQRSVRLLLRVGWKWWTWPTASRLWTCWFGIGVEPNNPTACSSSDTLQ